MSEQPAVFTLAPWGWRVLTPWAAAAVPTRNVARAFRVVGGVALLAAAVLCVVVARRAGVRDAFALPAAAAFALAPPVREAVGYVFLAEPLTVFLEAALVAAVLAGAGPGVLAVIAVLGVLGKEFFLLLLPLIFLLRAPMAGAWRGMRDTLLAALPAVLAAALLRAWWTPHIEAPVPSAGPATLVVALHRFHDSWPEWRPALLLGGIAPLALLGTVRRRADPMRWAAAYLTVAVLVPPLLNPVGFFPSDIPRLLIYALPLAVPLAAVALEPSPRGPGARPRHWWWDHAGRAAGTRLRGRDVAGLLAALALAAAPLLVVDRYRRADLRGPRDGPLLLATVRDGLRVARRLARGERVDLAPLERRFAWGVSHPTGMEGMRWFLREGWGEKAHYGTGEIRLRGAEGELLLPVLEPRDVAVEVGLRAEDATHVALAVNGRELDRWTVGEAEAAHGVRVPAAVLFRGDNTVTLRPAGGDVRLVSLVYDGRP